MGRGYSKDGNVTYIMEPQMMQSWWKDYEKLHLAAEEVTVTVLVKLKNRQSPIVLTRTYLPEYSYQELSKGANSDPYLRKLYQKKSLSKKSEGHTWWYDYQTDWIYRLFKAAESVAGYYMKNDFWTVTASSTSDATGLFDGSSGTPWIGKTAEKKNGVWYVEFKSNNGPVTLESYQIYAQQAFDAPQCPKSWRLLAKVDEKNNWTAISTVTNDMNVHIGGEYGVNIFPVITGFGGWNYFRLEVSENWGDANEMHIGELFLNCTGQQQNEPSEGNDRNREDYGGGGSGTWGY